MKKFLMGIFIGCLVTVSPVFAFSDVTEDYWAYNQISEMYSSGIISGFEDGTFKPADPITREQAAAIMTNFFEISLKEVPDRFEDVSEGYWSERFINVASQYMSIDEIDGKYYFRPFDNATRAEVAEAIIRIIGYDSEDTDEETLAKFSDNSTFLENDKKYISLAAKNGIMVGDNNLEFRPYDTITRAEFCSLIYNVYLMRGELKAQNSAKVVFSVNGEDVYYDEFNLYFKVQKKMYEALFGSKAVWLEEVNGESLYNLVKDATKEELIANEVKLQKANELGIVLSDEKIAEIEADANSETGAEICEFYGITADELIKINSESMIVNALQEEIYNTLDHSQHDHSDITKPVETMKYSARHILLGTEGLSEEDKAKAKSEAENLFDRVKSGEDFSALAKEYSIDVGSKDNGGLYEDVYVGEFVPEFENAALSISNGEIYPELVESTYGYHIIKLESKEETVRELSETEKQEIITGDFKAVSDEWVKESEVVVNEAVYKTF